jgi:hypothetical protein
MDGPANPDRGANALGRSDGVLDSGPVAAARCAGSPMVLLRCCSAGTILRHQKRWTRRSFPAKVGEMLMPDNRRERSQRSILQFLAGPVDQV